MAALSFSLAPEALYQLHDALTCLAKFHETVAIEAEFDLVRDPLGIVGSCIFQVHLN